MSQTAVAILSPLWFKQLGLPKYADRPSIKVGDLLLTSQANKVRLRTVLRQQEVETVFRRVPDAEFDEVLELGAGDGSQSRILVRCAKNVVCTELNADRLVQESHPNIRYQICDAEALPFEEGKFDLVYSSNLLEHLPQPEVALTEMYRVLSDDGVMVHIVPNRFWKFLHLSLFYPNQMVSMAGILLSSRKRETMGVLESRGNNLKGGEQPRFLSRNLWPAVHGEYPDHWSEFLRMGAPHWKRAFTSAGFQMMGYIGGLPVHSPYRFGMEGPRKVLEKAGFSSCNGYVLAKKGHRPRQAGLFVQSGAAS